MRVRICAVGRLRGGPEHDLVRDYLSRFDKTGRGLGLGPAEMVEVDDRNGGGMTAEAKLLAKAAAGAGVRCVLDERGRQVSSPEFAKMLGQWRDAGRGELVIMIGGADGLAPELRERADVALSFGKMVWPHMMARVMLCEQLYRAASILAGAPYHRA